MFRTAFSRISKGIVFQNVNSKAYFSSEARSNLRFREVNEVSLVGTVRFDSINLESGTKQVLVAADNQTYVIHLNSKLDYAAGQRIFVKGRLHVQQFTTAENRNVHRLTVKGNASYVLDEEVNEKHSSDRVSIDILANVCADIINKDDHSIFSLVTHFVPRNGYETVSQFHSVFVYEEDLREFVRTQLQKRDRVLVSGTVLHKTHTDAEGKRKYSGVIVANSIHKVAKRANSNEPEESA